MPEHSHLGSEEDIHEQFTLDPSTITETNGITVSQTETELEHSSGKTEETIEKRLPGYLQGIHRPHQMFGTQFLSRFRNDEEPSKKEARTGSK